MHDHLWLSNLRKVVGICCLEGIDNAWAVVRSVGRGALS